MGHDNKESEAKEEVVLKNCRLVITKDENGRLLEKVDILLKDGHIIEIGTIKDKKGIILDCSNALITPGFTDAHMHLICHDMTKAHSFARMVLLSALVNGVTNAVIFTNVPNVVMATAKEVGIHVRLAISPEEYKRFSNREMANTIISIEDPLSLPDLIESIDCVVELHIHISESRNEVFTFKRKYKRTPIAWLLDRNLSVEKVYLVNPNWIASWELELFKKLKPCIIWSPSTSMYRALDGFFPYKELSALSVPLAIGSCDSASLSISLLDELKIGSLLLKYNYWDPSLYISLNAVTTVGERIMGVPVGCVKIGYLADLILFDIKRLMAKGLDLKNIERAFIEKVSSHDIMMVISRGNVAYSRSRLPQVLEGVY